MNTLRCLLLFLGAAMAHADDGWGTLFTSQSERSGALGPAQQQASGVSARFDGEVRSAHGVSRWVDGVHRRTAPAGLKPGQRRVGGVVRDAYEPDGR
ncbi:hypothetical protein JHS3_29330 [Jeongeupia sp. HS-3]|uniref:hypothetical protein n=1 Tax=Jeongeupia sp. HS-3 TaxID=1009682 RepID=UPI0018A5C504|nr:hypothetical protein [Jeongeupia sp. HS-3]BCL77197.1 hypothetical protein JHS3_29330 [Jeongeupia sp. HS-3]